MSAKRPHRRIFLVGGLAAMIMFAFCFAMVPLYSIICKKTGLNTSIANGTLLTPSKQVATSVDLSREITVQLTTMTHMGLPWDFYPQTKIIRVHPGENVKVYFYAKNTTDHTMTVQAVPSMTPPDAMGYFRKIECFCFTHQTLAGHTHKMMPLIFAIDDHLPK